KPPVTMSRRYSLILILRLPGRGFLAWTPLFTLTATTLLPPLGAKQRSVPWGMRKDCNRTDQKPCSLWVIINTGDCLITGLPKPRSFVSASCYLVVARSHTPSAELCDAKDTGIKALSTSNRLSPWLHII